jgi:hypothetical protein
MNKDLYIRRIIRSLHCSNSKKREIRKQLETDIAIRMEQGESIEEIIAEMGAPEEFAEGFGENLSASEWRRYRRWHICRIILVVCIVFAAIVGLLYSSVFPKTEDISESTYFDAVEVETRMMEIVQLLDENDYMTLQSLATDRMRDYLTEGFLNDARAQITEDWGHQVSFGTSYMQEVTQMGKHYAVGEISVIYEKVSVTYRFSFDTDLKLDGLYMR